MIQNELQGNRKGYGGKHASFVSVYDWKFYPTSISTPRERRGWGQRINTLDPTTARIMTQTWSVTSTEHSLISELGCITTTNLITGFLTHEKNIIKGKVLSHLVGLTLEM